MAGAVYVSGERIAKPDRLVEEDESIEIKTNAIPYVGYGELSSKRPSGNSGWMCVEELRST